MMKRLLFWIEAALLVGLSLGASAQQAVFDANAGLLTLPAVRVDGAVYTNVRLGLIDSTNYTFRLQAATAQTPPGAADSIFDEATGILSVPTVKVGSALYADVALRITDAATYTFVLASARLQQPAISALRYSPASVVQRPNGTTTISGTFDFSDASGGIAYLRLVTSAGVDLTLPTPELNGIGSGTAVGYFVVGTDVVGHYTFELWVVDGIGRPSNRLSGTFDVVADDTAASWTTLNVSPPGILFSIGWNGFRYVAVGQGGTVMSSTDLSAWTVRSAGVAATLRSVAWSGTRWIAVGDNGTGQAAIVTSADGINWGLLAQAGGNCPPDCTTAPQYRLSKVIWTGTQFIAVGQELIYPGPSVYALIVTSPDGSSWTQRARRTVRIGSGEASGMTSIAWSGNRFVAVGIGPDSVPTAWTSLDAEQWTAVSLTGYGGQILRDVTWGNGRFVAIGWGGTPGAFSSSDGVTWTPNSGDFLPAMNAITTGPSRYLAVSNTSRETSADGLLWNSVPSFAACGNGVLWDGRRYVSVGISICTSP